MLFGRGMTWPPDREGGDPLAVGGVDPQLPVEGARTVGRVVGDRDPRLGAREDWLLRKFGHRAAARGHHVEDDQRPVAAVLSRERMAHRTVGFRVWSRNPTPRARMRVEPAQSAPVTPNVQIMSNIRVFRRMLPNVG